LYIAAVDLVTASFSKLTWKSVCTFAWQ